MRPSCAPSTTVAPSCFGSASLLSAARTQLCWLPGSRSARNSVSDPRQLSIARLSAWALISYHGC
jgi:hypothetical protein